MPNCYMALGIARAKTDLARRRRSGVSVKMVSGRRLRKWEAGDDVVTTRSGDTRLPHQAMRDAAVWQITRRAGVGGGRLEARRSMLRGAKTAADRDSRR